MGLLREKEAIAMNQENLSEAKPERKLLQDRIDDKNGTGGERHGSETLRQRLKGLHQNRLN